MHKMTVTNGYCLLRSEKWRVHLRPKNGHMFIVIKGPNGYRKQGLSSVKDDLSQFELKVAALYFWRVAREYDSRYREWIPYINYAEIFGSCFD